MYDFGRHRFDHVGFVSDEKRDNETWVETSRCWVTNPRSHPFNVEWLRFEQDTPITGKLRTDPHIAYRVDDISSAIDGRTVLSGPFEVGNGFAVVAFVEVDGLVIEFMQYSNPDEEEWF